MSYILDALRRAAASVDERLRHTDFGEWTDEERAAAKAARAAESESSGEEHA